MGTFTTKDHERMIAEGLLPKVGEEPDLGDPDDEEGDETPPITPTPPETPPEFKFEGDEVPEELRGRTAAEALQIYTQMKQVAQLAVRSAQQQPVPPQPPQPPPTPTAPLELTNEDLLDPSSLQSKLAQMMDAKTVPYVQSLQKINADANYNGAFQRYPWLAEYKGELDQMVTQLTVEQMANPMTIGYLALDIQNRHFDEIASKRTKPKPPPEESPTGDSIVTPTGSKSSQLTAEEKRVARALGVTEAAYAAMKPYTAR